MKQLLLLLLLSVLVAAHGVSLAPGGTLSLAPGGQMTLRGVAEAEAAAGWLNASMTSMIDPAPHQIIDTGGGGSGDLWKWFDHDEISTATYDMAAPALYIIYDFGTASAANVATLKIKNMSSYGLAGWILDASDDDITYTQIATGTAVDDETLQSFSFSNSLSYQYYKLSFDSSYDLNSLILYEVELWNP